MNLLRKSSALLFAFVFWATLSVAQSAQESRKPEPRKAGQSDDPLGPLLRQAEDAIERKDYAAAVQPLVSYLAQRPDDATAHFQLGFVYSAMERWEDAKAEYNKAIALNPKMVAAHLNLGLVLLELQPADAIEPLRQAAELLPDQARPRFVLGLALERSGNLPGAIEQYETAEGLDAQDFQVHFALGRALLRTDRATDAEAQFRQAIRLRGDSAPARLGLANSLLAQKKLETAAEEFRAYLERQPQDRESRLQLSSLLMEMKRYDQALAELDRGDASVPPSLASYKLRAAVYLEQKQLLQAMATLEKALQLDAQDAELHAKLGRLWLERREFGPAERELRRALELDPEWTDALRDLGAVYYLGEKFQAALDALDLLAQREKPNAGSWFVRATCYDKLERKAEAVAAYEQFLALDQGRSENHNFQARQRIRALKRELEQRKR